MLYIIFDSNNVREWHIGEPNPVKCDETHAIREVQMDGDELEHIKNMFDHPSFFFPKGRVVRLFGDLAKTIIGNL